MSVKTNMVFIKTCFRRSIYKFKCFQKPEFDGWKWVSKQEPLDLVINFKKNIYKMKINELMPLLDLNERQKYKNA